VHTYLLQRINCLLLMHMKYVPIAWRMVVKWGL
jgi:hypothetical protein